MSDIEKKADASKTAIKNEAVELHDDDLDAVAGGKSVYSKRCKGSTGKTEHVVEQYTSNNCKGKGFCTGLRSDDIDFIKGTSGKG